MGVKRSLLTSVIVALCISASLALVFRPGAYEPYAEGHDYFAMANGNYTNIGSYYACRVLHPMSVHTVAILTHTSISWRTFLIVSVASLIGFFSILGVYFGLEFRVQPWSFVPLLATAIVVDQYRNYYWHDLFYAMLCAAFFLVLRASRWAGLPILVLLFLTRESTIVLALVVVIVAAVRREWAFCSAALGTGILGFGGSKWLADRALPNHHGIPIALLDLLKIPYNFALNVCGLEFWTNTNATTTLDPLKWVVNLPPWVHLGNIHQIGYCGFFWQRPAKVLTLMSSAFGALPLLLVLAFVRRQAPSFFVRVRSDYAIAVAYGGLMFILAPLTGTIPARYILYAWPAFWIFGAALVFAVFKEKAKRLGFVLLCVIISWVPAVIRVATRPRLRGPSSFFELSNTGLILCVVVLSILYVPGYLLVRSAISQSGTS